jgi:hypothetical protein
LIGLIEVPTVALTVEDVSETASGVVNLVEVDEAPSPPLLVAVVTTE